MRLVFPDPSHPGQIQEFTICIGYLWVLDCAPLSRLGKEVKLSVLIFDFETLQFIWGVLLNLFTPGKASYID